MSAFKKKSERRIGKKKLKNKKERKEEKLSLRLNTSNRRLKREQMRRNAETLQGEKKKWLK